MNRKCCGNPRQGLFLGLPSQEKTSSADEVTALLPALVGFEHLVKKPNVSYAHIHFRDEPSAALFAQEFLGRPNSLVLRNGSRANVKEGQDSAGRRVKYQQQAAAPPVPAPGYQAPAAAPPPPQNHEVPRACTLVSSHQARITATATHYILRIQVPLLELRTVDIVATGGVTINVCAELIKDGEAVVASTEAEKLTVQATLPSPVEDEAEVAFAGGLLTVEFWLSGSACALTTR
ncbi:hypothetical protein HDU87_000465 [Geranomyces variabilis]|uniref:Uncharacterized protein n=1 Tax=Geranomyces variabilis TaxID=109894 RepID=A0AAD5TDZ4_9FUNG|nr:hypothetical protein HDU87_000465 [Geranomyces variabilis]